jgi:hypothetical protein
MPRNPNIPKVKEQYLYYRSNGKQETIKIGSARWFEWLAEARSFAFEGDHGHFTARKEGREDYGEYWYAYQWHGKTVKVYLGADRALTPEKLKQAARKLSRLHIERKSQMNKSRPGKVPVPP